MKRIVASLVIGMSLLAVMQQASAASDTTGAVIGGVVGGVAGHALIGGPVATIAGTLGGAYLGKEIAHNHRHHGHHHHHHHHPRQEMHGNDGYGHD